MRIKNYFRKRKASKFIKKSWLNNALEAYSKYDKDSIKILEEVNRLRQNNEIPFCFHLEQSKDFKIRTLLGSYSHSYLRFLKALKSNPEMTLKEFNELEKN